MTPEREAQFDLVAQNAYERGYRRGRIEASAEMHSLYRDRILEATTLLSAPIPKAPAEPAQEKT